MEANSTARLSFATDIRPMFNDIDVAHMLHANMNLADRADVEKHAAAILKTVSSGAMPPPGESRRWTPEMCSRFEQWIAQGYPA